MPCFHPLRAHQDADGSVFFVERHGRDSVRQLELACGQCAGCRLERSRQWAVRCVHEASLYARNAFVTLTYAEDPGTLCYRDFQLFMKRLRKTGRKARFFVCGEYGESFGRAHFHACLFNCSFEDQYYWRSSGAGFRLFRSAELERLWPHGHAEIGEVTFESAAYVARYVMKKVTGQLSDVHYDGREPEFCHMSLKPGIGGAWLDRFSV